MAAVCLLPLSLQANEEPSAPKERSAVNVVSAGTNAYAPGRWSTLELGLFNRSERPVDVLCSTSLADDSRLQYGRRVRLPSRAQMRTSHPILIPAAASRAADQLEFRTLVLEGGPGEARLMRDNSGRLQLDGTLRIGRAPLTGVIDRYLPADDPEGFPQPAAFDLVMAGRVSQNLPPEIALVGEEGTPARVESLDALDHLVIADDAMLSDGAALSAVRRWLYGGGRLWVMLDQVDERLLAAVLGDRFAMSVVDRSSVTTVRIVPGPAGDPGAFFEVEFEQPVGLTRLIAVGADVAYEINGWPAAYWMTCGQGRLLVTTLGSRAWMLNRHDLEGPTLESHLATPFIPIDPMKSLAGEFFIRRPPELLPAAALETTLEEYVGVPVPSRSLVTWMLAGYSVVLTAVGCWFWRAGRLERLGIAGPVLGCVWSMGLMLYGSHQRQALVPMAAVLQFVEPIVGTDDVCASGAAALYADEPGTAAIAGKQGGRLIPDWNGITANARRLVWTDLDEWQWENVPQIPGLQKAVFAETSAASTLVQAHATYAPQGLIGHLTSPPNMRPTDAVLATRDGRMGVHLEDNGHFTAGARQNFSSEQFISAGLLNDEQHRRSRILRSLLENGQTLGFPDEPTLLFWTDPWDVGLRFGEGMQTFGSALVSCRLVWHRPAPHTEVTIPSALLPYRETVGPDGLRPARLYVFHTRQWQEKSWASSTWLRFQVPPVLLPFEPRAATMVVDVTGPVGRLSISVPRQKDVQVWNDPVGVLAWEVTDASMLALDEQGGLLMRIDGGDPDHPESMQTHPGSMSRLSWRILSLSLELRGTVLESVDGGLPDSVRP